MRANPSWGHTFVFRDACEKRRCGPTAENKKRDLAVALRVGVLVELNGIEPMTS